MTRPPRAPAAAALRRRRRAWLGSLRPGAASTPEPTSSAQAPSRAAARGVAGLEAAGEQRLRRARAGRATRDQSKARPVPPVRPPTWCRTGSGRRRPGAPATSAPTAPAAQISVVSGSSAAQRADVAASSSPWSWTASSPSRRGRCVDDLISFSLRKTPTSRAPARRAASAIASAAAAVTARGVPGTMTRPAWVAPARAARVDIRGVGERRRP